MPLLLTTPPLLMPANNIPAKKLPKHIGFLSKLRGFTLIEMLIAVTLATMLLLTISAMFMTFLASGAKTNIKKNIIQEGNHSLSQINFLLKNATRVVPNSEVPPKTCEQNMDRIAISSRDGWITEFRNEAQKIASVSGQVIPSEVHYLTSTDVTLASGPEFDCNQDGGATFITTSFTLSKNTTDGNATENFSSSIQVRNN